MHLSFKNGKDFKELISLCISGDAVSQRELYSHFYQKMFTVCLRYAKDFHAAEDILQEGFVKIYKNLHKFRGDGSFEGWIRRIFVNTAIEHYRKAVNLYPLIEVVNSDRMILNTNAVDDLAAADILNLVQSLSPGYRTVFNLYVIEGFSHREIAEKLKISEGTSKSQLARARYILQKLVKEASDYHYGKEAFL